MPLDYRVESLEDVDEKYRDEYTKVTKNDKTYFEFNIGGVKPQDEFDIVHKSMLAAREDTRLEKAKLKSFGEYTPDTINDMVAKIADFELQANKQDENKKEMLENAIKARMLPFNDEMAKLKELNDSLTANNEVLKAEKIDGALRRIITSKISDPKSGIMPEAYEDIYSRATRKDIGVFWNEDSKSFLDEGMNSFDTWFTLQAEKSLWRKPSQSANARGGNTGIESNPWSKGKENYTEQAKIQNSDPEKALRLKKSAGY